MSQSELNREGNLRKTVLSLSWPAVTRTGLNMLVQMVDLAMVGWLETTAIAVVRVSNQIFFLTIGRGRVASAFGIGAIALVAQNVGAAQIARAKNVPRQAIMITAMSTFCMTLMGVFGAQQLLGMP